MQNKETPTPVDHVELGEVTDDMLNEGQERLCQMSARTYFNDHEQAEIYKAMRAVDPAFRQITNRGEQK